MPSRENSCEIYQMAVNSKMKFTQDFHTGEYFQFSAFFFLIWYLKQQLITTIQNSAFENKWRNINGNNYKLQKKRIIYLSNSLKKTITFK